MHVLLASWPLFHRVGGIILSRWAHFLAGITWIGLLYYFNFVQTPAFAAFEAGPRNEAFAKLVPRAMWWFRYGALSTLSGRLSLNWGIAGDVLQMVWEERDGPVVEKPASRGFGTRSVIASIESQLGGQAEFDWRSEGLICRLSVPLSPEITVRRVNLQSLGLDRNRLN